MQPLPKRERKEPPIEVRLRVPVPIRMKIIPKGTWEEKSLVPVRAKQCAQGFTLTRRCPHRTHERCDLFGLCLLLIRRMD